MKTLCLVRHAKSSWADPSLTDFERPLNNRGKRDAPFMGKRLLRANLTPSIIVSSPARRARDTARMIAREIGFDKKKIDYREEIYHADEPAALLEVVSTRDPAVETMVLVGHNFVITECAEQLTGVSIASIPTCGIVAIVFDCHDWREVRPARGRLLFFDYPKLHSSRSR